MKKKIVLDSKREALVTEKDISSLEIKKLTLRSGLKAGLAATCCGCHTANNAL
jgi:hypothetical protein